MKTLIALVMFLPAILQAQKMPSPVPTHPMDNCKPDLTGPTPCILLDKDNPFIQSLTKLLPNTNTTGDIPVPPGSGSLPDPHGTFNAGTAADQAPLTDDEIKAYREFFKKFTDRCIVGQNDGIFVVPCMKLSGGVPKIIPTPHAPKEEKF